MSGKKTVNLLHLTDLHFGYENPKDNIARGRRHEALSSLIETLRGLKDTEWKPDLIAISGDLSWKGKPEGYTELEKWLNDEVFRVTGLSAKDCVICPGNHDLNRGPVVTTTPEPAQADAYLHPNNLPYIPKARFEAYETFAGKLGIPMPELNGKPNRLVGVVTLEGIQFVCLNSAWFCMGDADSGSFGLGCLSYSKCAGSYPIRKSTMKRR